MCWTSVWVVWNLRGRDEKVNERSRLGTGGGGELESGLAPFVGVAFGLGLAMLANLENGLFAVSLGGLVRGVVARDYWQGELANTESFWAHLEVLDDTLQWGIS